MLRSLHESAQLDVAKVVLFDTVAASRGRLLSVIREHGVKKTISKVSGLLLAKLGSRLGRVSESGEPHFSRDYAERNGIDCEIVKTVNSKDFVRRVKELQADFFVVCSFSQIIKRGLIDVPRAAAINIHPSLLPKYRGPEPVFWALYHREAESGVSYHKIEPGVDTGDIIHQVRMPIPQDATVDELTEQLFDLAGRHVEEAILGLQRGTKEPQAQDENAASYFSFPSAVQRKELADRSR